MCLSLGISCGKERNFKGLELGSCPWDILPTLINLRVLGVCVDELEQIETLVESIPTRFSFKFPTDCPPVGDIVVIYFELVEQSPSQLNKLTTTLVTLKNSPSPPATDLENQCRYRLLSPLTRPQCWAYNELLIASLLSAVATKDSLCHYRLSCIMMAMI